MEEVGVEEYTVEELEAYKLNAEILKIEAETEELRIKIEHADLKLSRDKSVSAEHEDLLFYNEVSDGSVYNAIAAMNQWSKRFPGRDLRLTFDSPGGGVFDGLHFWDYIQLLKKTHHVTTVGMGHVASMGGVLLQAGTKRAMSKNAYLMIHEVSAFTGGKLTDLQDETAFCKSLQAKLVGILAERSTMSVRQIQARMERRDWWMDADEALKLGFIDEIC